MLNLQFSATEADWHDFGAPIIDALDAAGVQADLRRDHAPELVDYIIYAPGGPLVDFTAYTRTKAVLGLWAGVEKIVTNKTLTQPLARMNDHGLTQGMTEWVAGHTLRHHLEMDRNILGQDGVWRQQWPPLAQDRPVTVLGLGALGAAAGQALAQLGFPVTGWSRSQKDIAGVRCLSGTDGLQAALQDAQIVVLLLPLTAETENTMNATRLAQLPHGAVIINPGRGPLIDDAALLSALDAGQIAHATLDVFRIEPLPVDHPYWAHPQVTVTPHIAAATRPKTGAIQIVQNIIRSEAGEPMLHLVDRAAGY